MNTAYDVPREVQNPKFFRREWLADTVRMAADQCLSLHSDDAYHKGLPLELFSCLAIEEALNRRVLLNEQQDDARVKDYRVLCELLQEVAYGMGLRGVRSYGNAFPKPKDWHPVAWDVERQQARYAWLYFVALIIEEQGVKWAIRKSRFSPTVLAVLD